MLSVAKRFFRGLFVAAISFLSASGCVYLGVGALGAVGGYMVSPDTVEGILNAEYKTVWQAAYDEAEKCGAIIVEDETGGHIMIDADGIEVTIQIIPADVRDSWKIAVKARRNMFPKVRLAQKIYTDIHDAVLP